MLKRNLAVAVVSLAMAVWASMASLPATAALTPAVTVSGGSPSMPGAGTEQGWEFDTNKVITVRALGVFDQGSDGLTDDHLVSLWDASDSSLITSATIPSGTSATLIHGFRYVSIFPEELASGGTFVISAFYPSSDDLILVFAGITSVSGITVTDGRAGFSAGFPTEIDTFERFGPNFLVPLPATLSLFLSALAGLGFFGWRRRMTAGA